MDASLAKIMQKKYVNFILNGNPNRLGEILVWPQYKEEQGEFYRTVMEFGDIVRGPSARTIVDPMKHYRCDFWQDAPYALSDDWLTLKNRLALKEQTSNNQFEL